MQQKAQPQPGVGGAQVVTMPRPPHPLDLAQAAREERAS
jgi:hypothetical protein